MVEQVDSDEVCEFGDIERDILPDKKKLGLSGFPYRLIDITRLSSRHTTLSQAQQSVPACHVASIPEGSAVMPFLKPSKPASSSG